MATVNPFWLKANTDITLSAAKKLLALNEKYLQEKGYPYQGIEKRKGEGIASGAKLKKDHPEVVSQYHVRCGILEEAISMLTILRDSIKDVNVNDPAQLNKLKEIYSKELNDLFDPKKIEELKKKKNLHGFEKVCINIANNKDKPLDKQLDQDFMLFFLQEKYRLLNKDFKAAQSELGLKVVKVKELDKETQKTNIIEKFEVTGSRVQAFEEFLKNPQKPKETLEQIKEKIGSDSMIEDEPEDRVDASKEPSQTLNATGMKQTISDLTEGAEPEEDWDAPASPVFTPSLDKEKLKNKEQSPGTSTPTVKPDASGSRHNNR